MLGMLRNSRAPVSGEAAAEALGISRVAVWKAVQALNESGYRIAASPAGYVLEADKTDSVCPWEFGPEEKRFRHREETGSTMDVARDEALKGCADGLVVLADRQSDGRGTGGKKWESCDGGLFFTMVTRPAIGAAYAHRQVLRAQIAMIDAIRTVTGQDAAAGWPNDILLPSGKAGGILCETLTSGNAVTFLDLGIGINTGKSPNVSTAPSGTASAASVPTGRKRLLEAFLSSFSLQTPKSVGETGDDLVRAWNALCPVTGKEVRFREGENGIRSGVFVGVDEAGWAIVQSEDTRHYPPGCITILDKGIHS